MSKTYPYRLFGCLLGMLFLIVFPAQANEDVLNKRISLPKSKGTVYKLLGQVSDRSGFLFIYDSHVVDNDRETFIKGGEYTLREVITEITGQPALLLHVVNNHIILSLPGKEENPPELTISVVATPPEYLTVEGKILDKYNHEPIAFATVGIPEAAIGTVTNLNGEFRFRFPDSLRRTTLQFAHLGYEPVEVEAGLLAGGHQRLSLEPRVISLQEVIVRMVNPEKAIDDMLRARQDNYPVHPVYQTAFYREGIERRKGLLSLTEAVFRIYKTPFDQSSADQVKLLKMRRIVDNQERDTIVTKFKSGIHASLMLDLVKNLPDFLSREERVLYDYAHSDIRVVDDRLVNVITFEQKKGIHTPLFKGELYIDTENFALAGAQFEIHPRFVNKSASMFVEKKSRDLTIIPQKIQYTVSYKARNGIYYLNHVRGDLEFRIRKKRRLFSTTIHTWFEMAVGKTDTSQVARFDRSERLPTRTVFAETHFVYDKDFWENFNFIVPEERLNTAINKISSMIEETEF